MRGRGGIEQSTTVVVVGAGIAGVACARELHAAGVQVRVIDRGRRIGGRMASRTLAHRPTDLGASYLTVSGGDFGAVVEDWRARGLAFAWADTFAVLAAGEEPATKSGPVRWGAAGGLRSLVEDLADQGGVHPEQGDVQQVTVGSDGLLVDGAAAAAVVLAMPDAQALRLLGEGLAQVRARLDRESEPILALAARWPERTWDATVTPGRFDGAFVNGDDDVSWVADDGRRRGDDAPVLVAHSTPALAARHLADPDAAAPAMVAALRRVLRLDSEPEQVYLHRWSLARPTGEREDPYLLTEPEDGAPLGVCGDSWGPSPKVETAWRSGRDLARALLPSLGHRLS